MSVYISQICDMCTDQRAIEIGPHPDNIECAIRRDGWEKINNVFPRTQLKTEMGVYAGKQDNDPVICPKCVEELRTFIKFYAKNKDDAREAELNKRPLSAIKGPIFNSYQPDRLGHLEIFEDGSISGQFTDGPSVVDNIVQRMRSGHCGGFKLDLALIPAEEQR